MSIERLSKWLVLSGPLSRYMIDLFEAVERKARVEVEFLYVPLAGKKGFAHEGSPVPLRGRTWEETDLFGLVLQLRASPPDVVFLLGTQPATLSAAVLAAVPRRTPIIFASDANILASEGATLKKKLAYFALTLRVRTALTLGSTNAEALRQLGFRRLLGLPIYAVDFEKFALRASRSANVARPRVLVVTRLVAAKNLSEFLRAFSKHESRDTVELHIVGDGPLREELQSMIKQSGLHNVQLRGALPRAQVANEMGAADLLLLPSVREPWGIVVVEALGTGLPVVASPAVGAAVSLEPWGGIVVSRSVSGEDLADALFRAVEDLPGLSGAALKAAPLVRDKYSKESVASALVELVRSGNLT